MDQDCGVVAEGYEELDVFWCDPTVPRYLAISDGIEEAFRAYLAVGSG